MTEAKTAVRRFYESLSTGDATLADEILTPDAKTSRCPAISAHTHNERCVLPPNYLRLIYGPRISADIACSASRLRHCTCSDPLPVHVGEPTARLGRVMTGAASCQWICQ